MNSPMPASLRVARSTLPITPRRRIVTDRYGKPESLNFDCARQESSMVGRICGVRCGSALLATRQCTSKLAFTFYIWGIPPSNSLQIHLFRGQTNSLQRVVICYCQVITKRLQGVLPPWHLSFHHVYPVMHGFLRA
ncbi:hypothetical protein SDC9_174107 [bioreactor metagenome]|uniref:Uncharacterized protein n=1 Tax=bioreactor metagenome TaxID=1076179 RepID=A0A645GLD4_9ZZZZ